MENPPSPGDSPGGVERQEIVDTLARLRDRPPPTDPSSGGCAAAIVAIITLVFMPFIGRGFDLSSNAMLGLGIALGLVVLLGGLLGIFGSGFVRAAVSGDAEEAIDQLVAAYPYGDPAILRQAAVRILDQSSVSTGPVTVETFDHREVAARLGDALAYVLQVERILLERKEIYPCFTLLEPGVDDRDGGWQWMDDEP